MSSMEQEQKIHAILRLIACFENKPFILSYNKHTLHWKHPITNEGMPDPDYLVFSIEKGNVPSIWSFQGVVNIECTIEDFTNAKVTEDDLIFLEQACRHAVVKVRTRKQWIPKWFKFGY